MIGWSSSSVKAAAVTHVQVVALYDKESGEIRHLHAVTTLGAAKPPTSEEATAEARALARGRSPDVEALGVALSDDPEHAQAEFTIDPKTNRFVAVRDRPDRA